MNKVTQVAALPALGLALALAAGFAPPAHAGGFDRPDTMSFSLRSPALALNRVAMRTSINNGAGSQARNMLSGSSANAQTQTNMANVVQITENYEIILNGDNNVVSTVAGGARGDQSSFDTNQRADNQVNSSSDVDNRQNNTPQQTYPIIGNGLLN
jgi:hypothetical protein